MIFMSHCDDKTLRTFGKKKKTVGLFIKKCSKFTANSSFSDKRQCAVAARRLLVVAAASLAEVVEKKLKSGISNLENRLEIKVRNRLQPGFQRFWDLETTYFAKIYVNSEVKQGEYPKLVSENTLFLVQFFNHLKPIFKNRFFIF